MLTAGSTPGGTTGTALIAVTLVIDNILSASDGNGEEHEDTWKQQTERMDKEATGVDTDAIDTDMHARAGDVELIPWVLVPHCAPQLSFCERHRGRVAVTLVACFRI